MFKLAVIVLVASTTFGCVQVPYQNENSHTQLSISSVRDLPTVYAKGSTFSVLPTHAKKQSLSAKQLQAFYQLYANKIIENLEAQGYQYVASGQTDFEVGYLVALEQDLSDDTINEKFGVSPGLHVTDNLEKGSFLIYIEDKESLQRIWRGAVQGFVQEEFTPVEREQRVVNVINMVLSQFNNVK